MPINCTSYFIALNLPLFHRPGRKSVGLDIPHLSSMKQVCGEAIYTDDIPLQQNELYAAPVWTNKAHAKITRYFLHFIPILLILLSIN